MRPAADPGLAPVAAGPVLALFGSGSVAAGTIVAAVDAIAALAAAREDPAAGAVTEVLSGEQPSGKLVPGAQQISLERYTPQPAIHNVRQHMDLKSCTQVNANHVKQMQDSKKH